MGLEILLFGLVLDIDIDIDNVGCLVFFCLAISNADGDEGLETTILYEDESSKPFMLFESLGIAGKSQLCPSVTLANELISSSVACTDASKFLFLLEDLLRILGGGGEAGFVNRGGAHAERRVSIVMSDVLSPNNIFSSRRPFQQKLPNKISIIADIT